MILCSLSSLPLCWRRRRPRKRRRGWYWKKLSSELRLATPGGQKFEGQAGLYAYYSELDSVGTLAQGQSLYENAIIRIEGTTIDALMSLFFPKGSVNTDDNLYTTTSFAAFGQVIWNINEEFGATLGMRYTYEKKEREGSQTSDPVPPLGPGLVRQKCGRQLCRLGCRS